jgi:hypothetical protein
MPDRLTQDRSTHPDFCGCPSCTAWADYHEARHALDLLSARDAELRHAKPATQAEWDRFFNAEFPRSPA